jgi:hypothetical protein
LDENRKREKDLTTAGKQGALWRTTRGLYRGAPGYTEKESIIDEMRSTKDIAPVLRTEPSIKQYLSVLLSDLSGFHSWLGYRQSPRQGSGPY